MGYTLIEKSASIVLRGHLCAVERMNPLWMAKQELLRREEIENAEINIVSPAITAFRLDWLNFEAQEDRILLETKDIAYYEVIRDLCVGLIHLSEKPSIRTLGLNCHLCYEFTSVKEWHNLGHTLAPKAVWKPLLVDPGMEKISILDYREDPKGYVKVEVFPPKGRENIVIFAINNHYSMEEKDIGFVEQTLLNYWLSDIEFSTKITTQILEAKHE